MPRARWIANPALADRLLDEIGRARIVAAAKMPANAIGIGSSVTYRDDANGQERTVTLVYPEEADIARQRVSVMTPIGVALLGLSEGASFYWDTRDNQRRMLTVIKGRTTRRVRGRLIPVTLPQEPRTTAGGPAIDVT